MKDLQTFMVRLEQWKEVALRHLWAWARTTDGVLVDEYFPELELDHVCSQIALIEQQVEKLSAALKERISPWKASQTKGGVILKGGEMGGPRPVGVQTLNTTQAVSSRPVPEPKDDSTLMTGTAAAACPSQPLKEVKVAVEVKEDETLEIRVVRKTQPVAQEVEKSGEPPEDYVGAFWVEARAKGPCPDCGLLHVWESRRGQKGGTVQWPSEQFWHCPLFLEMSPA